MTIHPNRNLFANAANVLRERLSGFMGYSHSGNRNLYDVFGYPRQLQIAEMEAMYKRNAIANRIIRAYPQGTWRDCPVIRDEAGSSADKEGDDYSPFVEAVEDFLDATSALRYIERADRLASLGRYGVLVLGFADGLKFDKPLGAGKSKLIYIQPYSESAASVNAWDTNPQSPRFGKPATYLISQSSSLSQGSFAAPIQSFVVHHSRVIHISEMLEDNEVFGTPRLMSIYNNLLDLEKVVGGAAETFWLCANRGVVFTVDAESNLTDEARTLMSEQADEMQHQLRRYMIGQGINATVLGSESPDPAPNAEKLLDIISGGSGIPKRILLGTERGELASSQDENNWNNRLTERKKNFADPSVLRPFIQLMIATGNLPTPTGKFWIEWNEEENLGPVVEAAVAFQRMQTISTYVNTPGIELVLSVDEMRTQFIGMEPQGDGFEADPILDQDLPEDEKPDVEPENDNEADDIAANSTPATLYVSRKVVNAKAILDWAKSQGFKNLEKRDELHVTVCYSKSKIDWMKAGNDWGDEEDGTLLIPPGGPRAVEILGDDAITLEFTDERLKWRHQQIVDAGVAHGYSEYRPHITFARGASIPDDVTPYTGPIVLGVEIFEEIRE